MANLICFDLNYTIGDTDFGAVGLQITTRLVAYSGAVDWFAYFGAVGLRIVVRLIGLRISTPLIGLWIAALSICAL